MRLAIILPAYNEAASITQTVVEYAQEFPDAQIIVVDNNSSDETYDLASGISQDIIVLQEFRQGKGHAVRTGLSSYDADVYVMADADLTYLAKDARLLVDKLVSQRCEMVIGDRISSGGYSKQNHRPGHTIGNAFLTGAISTFTGRNYKDVLSGLRVMSRPFLDSIAPKSAGFQLETEYNIAAAYLNAKVLEVPIDYRQRIENSDSKLNTILDGLRILYAAFIGGLQIRPMASFGLAALSSFILSLSAGLPVILEWISTGQMTQPGLTVLAASLGVVSILSVFTGLILSVISRNSREDRMSDMLARKRLWLTPPQSD